MKKRLVTFFSMTALAACSLSCTASQKHVEQDLKNFHVNCATAEGDIRMLQHEKTHVMQQIGAGLSAIVPAGAVVGMVSGTEGENFKVATGEYNKMIDQRIAQIKAECGL